MGDIPLFPVDANVLKRFAEIQLKAAKTQAKEVGKAIDEKTKAQKKLISDVFKSINIQQIRNPQIKEYLKRLTIPTKKGKRQFYNYIKIDRAILQRYLSPITREIISEKNLFQEKLNKKINSIYTLIEKECATINENVNPLKTRIKHIPADIALKTESIQKRLSTAAQRVKRERPSASTAREDNVKLLADIMAKAKAFEKARKDAVATKTAASDFTAALKAKELKSSPSHTTFEAKNNPPPSDTALNAIHAIRSKSKEVRQSHYPTGKVEILGQEVAFHKGNRRAFVEIPKTLFARGGHNFAYLAYDLKNDNLVVMKKNVDEVGFFEEKYIEGDRLVAEKVRSPNVLKNYLVTKAAENLLLDMDLTGGYGVIFSEYVQGGDLNAIITEKPDQSIVNRLNIALGFGRGIKAYHDAKLCHFDINSKNVLLDISNFKEEEIIDPNCVKVFDNDTVCDLTTLVDRNGGLNEKALDEIFNRQATDLYIPQEMRKKTFVKYKEDLKRKTPDEMTKSLQKRDVYSFSLAMVQLFLGCTEKALGAITENPEQLQEDKKWKVLLQNDKPEVQKVLRLIVQGLEEDPEKRPTMNEFVAALEAASAALSPK